MLEYDILSQSVQQRRLKTVWFIPHTAPHSLRSHAAAHVGCRSACNQARYVDTAHCSRWYGRYGRVPRTCFHRSDGFSGLTFGSRRQVN